MINFYHIFDDVHSIRATGWGVKYVPKQNLTENFSTKTKHQLSS